MVKYWCRIVQLGQEDLVEKLLRVTGRESGIRDFTDSYTKEGKWTKFTWDVYSKICTQTETENERIEASSCSGLNNKI